MVDVVACPDCGTEYVPAEKLKGLCPSCLVERLQQQLFPSGAAIEEGDALSVSGARFPSPSPADLAPYFPQFEVLEIIGQGGMGAVYKVRQTKLDRIVALKILPKEVGGQHEFGERFEQEAKLLARLSHPNIVTIHDYGRAGDWFYFIMEYIDGSTLRQIIRKKTLTCQQTLEIVPKICEAIQYAHEQCIVHRDIKPENILLDQRGNVKIADFGLAKLLSASPHAALLTRTQQVMGTPHYMAPEQMDDSTDVDHRADIYSLGVVLYEMLTGELPLGQFQPPSSKVHVDVWMDQVVLRALAREPGRRYQHVHDLKSDMESLNRSKSAGGISDSEKFSLSKLVSRAHWYFLAACSLASYVAGLCFITVFFSEHHDRMMFLAAAVPPFLLAFILARFLAGFATSWKDFRFSHWLVTPPLLTGYALLTLFAVLLPLLVLIAVGQAPTYAGVQPGKWEVFGEFNVNNSATQLGLNPYWLKIYGWGAVASVVWTFILAIILRHSVETGRTKEDLDSKVTKWRPYGTISVVAFFHPASSAAIRIAIGYATVLLGGVLLPTGCLLLYIAYMGTF